MSKKAKIVSAAIAVVSSVFATRHASAAAFVSGNDLVVVRLGDGATGSPNNNAGVGGAPIVTSKVFLDEYDVSGATPVYKNTVALPSSGAGALVTSSATSYRDGVLNRSADGKFLLYTGYRATADLTTPGVDNDPALASAANVIGVIGASGVADTSVSFAGTSGLAIRSAASTNGQDIWFTKDGANSVQYYSATNVAGTLATVTSKAYRLVFASSTQLYGSTGTTATVKGVHAFSPGLPTGAVASDPKIANGTLDASAASVIVLDLDPTIAGDDTLYGVFTSSFEKFSKTAGGTWVSNGALAVATGKEFGVAAKSNGLGGIDLFFNTDQAIFKLADGGYNTALAGSLGSAYITPGFGLGLDVASNTAFRGIAIAPVPEPTSIAVLSLIGLGALARRRAR